jgi:hypothetical protein
MTLSHSKWHPEMPELKMSAEEKKYFTPAELVERYEGKITVRTLANWRSAGTSPPFTKVGGRILYPVKELFEWERKRTVQSTSMYGRVALLLTCALVSFVKLELSIA